ncbi:hypothetical protein [Salinicola halophilus]|uniref:hypothetical protein n=1 Tax=Salinicola halophilus TaxID=184065 RepID=UPI000DA18526|nr:hypothetical protein [Salinicola halophilus]
MADIEQLKQRIKDAVAASQEERRELEASLNTKRADLNTLQSQIETWVKELDLDQSNIQYTAREHVLEKFSETYRLELNDQVIDLGACKIHVRPEDGFLDTGRTLLFATSDEDDVKEIIESDGEHYISDLQFGHKRHLSQYDTLTEEIFYKLLYAWLKL